MSKVSRRSIFDEPQLASGNVVTIDGREIHVFLQRWRDSYEEEWFFFYSIPELCFSCKARNSGELKQAMKEHGISEDIVETLCRY